LNPKGFHYVFKETLEKKKIKGKVEEVISLLPKQSKSTQHIIVHFITISGLTHLGTILPEQAMLPSCTIKKSPRLVHNKQAGRKNTKNNY
jgi:hypothetical protein